MLVDMLLQVLLCLIILAMISVFVLLMFPILISKILSGLMVYKSPFTKKNIKLPNGLHCSYLERGNMVDCHETVLCLHGFTVDSTSFIEVGKRFESCYHVILMDWLNHGDSSELKENVYAHDIVKFVDKFVEAKGLGHRKFHLVGHSTGGYIAVDYAASHGASLATLSLISPLGVKLSDIIVQKQTSDVIYYKTNEDVHNFHQFVSSGRMKRLPFFMLSAIRHARNNRSQAYTNVYKNTVITAKFTKELMDKIADVPSLLIWGDDDWLLPTKAGVEFFRTYSKKTEVCLIEECGHMPIICCSGKVVAILQQSFAKNKME